VNRPASPERFPRGALIGAATLIAFSILAAGVGRLNGAATVDLASAVPVQSVELRFSDRSDGAVVVRQASDDREIYVVAPGTNGFIRSVLRGLARYRMLESIDNEPPFRLTRWDDGRLSLEDPATGRRIDELAAFGPTNAGAFEQILQAREEGS
jgi:putative photosynthetic complex assembly protein